MEKIYILQKVMDEAIEAAKKEQVSYYLMAQLDRAMELLNSLMIDFETPGSDNNIYTSYPQLF